MIVLEDLDHVALLIGNGCLRRSGLTPPRHYPGGCMSRPPARQSLQVHSIEPARTAEAGTGGLNAAPGRRRTLPTIALALQRSAGNRASG
jgi:hypothetical protein